MGALHALVGFLGALTNADADGRIILDTPAATAKFVLLNAAAHFHKVRLGILPPGAISDQRSASDPAGWVSPASRRQCPGAITTHPNATLLWACNTLEMDAIWLQAQSRHTGKCI